MKRSVEEDEFENLVQIAESHVALTEEQKQKMEQNRKIAELKRSSKKKLITEESPISKGKQSHSQSLFHDTGAGFIQKPISELKQQSESAHLPIRMDPPLQYPLSSNPTCQDCQTSIELDSNLYNHFKILVCPSCRDKRSHYYQLITKTEAKSDYLLTDAELKDEEILPHWERPNPQRGKFAYVHLYVRAQVEAFAWQKWGSEEALDKEHEKRELQLQARKSKQFKNTISELRRKTQTSQWLLERHEASKKIASQHLHEFGTPWMDKKDADKRHRKCLHCPFIETFEEL